MIQEDYVSFETAKLLKEKGFDEKTISFYPPGDIQRPTIQMAMKWLREEKEIFVTIGFCDYPALHKSEWIPEVCTHDSIFDEPSIIAYSTYEEACEAAIKYCLENLISDETDIR